jgi:hypothetical protein
MFTSNAWLLQRRVPHRKAQSSPLERPSGAAPQSNMARLGSQKSRVRCVTCACAAGPQAASWQRLLGAKKQVVTGVEHGHPHQATDFLIQCLRDAVDDSASAASGTPQQRSAPLQRSCSQRSSQNGGGSGDGGTPAAAATPQTPQVVPPRAALTRDEAAVQRALRALGALAKMLRAPYNRIVFAAADGVPALAALLQASHNQLKTTEGALLTHI